jgi:hypothetical protein
MIDLFQLILGVVASLFKSRARLEAEILVLRQQINVLRRQTPRRPQLNNIDRSLLVWLYRWVPSVLAAVAIIRPETIIRWHRGGFRTYWRWRSRNRVGLPRVSAELRDLIRRMSKENLLWGAPRIHGQLLMLGFEVAQSTVARYMCRRLWPPSGGRFSRIMPTVSRWSTSSFCQQLVSRSSIVLSLCAMDDDSGCRLA